MTSHFQDGGHDVRSMLDASSAGCPPVCRTRVTSLSRCSFARFVIVIRLGFKTQTVKSKTKTMMQRPKTKTKTRSEFKRPLIVNLSLEAAKVLMTKDFV